MKPEDGFTAELCRFSAQMTPLTLQDVLAHQASVPWPDLFQVEQDLLLSLSMRAIFDDPFLSAQFQHFTTGR
jgi:hypothetical protein